MGVGWLLQPEEPQRILDILNHRWVQEILRAVATGPQRKRDLMGALGTRGEPVHQKTLGATLSLLRSHGMISGRVVRDMPRIVVYESTPFGLQLVELLDSFRLIIEVHQAELNSRTVDDPAEDNQS